MSIKQTETYNVNGSQLAEQGPSSGKCSQQENIGCHHVNPVIVSKGSGLAKRI